MVRVHERHDNNGAHRATTERQDTMSDETYNGWTNRETWAVALHVNNDQGWQESVLDAIRAKLIEEGEDYSFGEVTDATRARWAGEAIRDNVDDWLQEFRNAAWESGTGVTVDEYESVREEFGSLWRVDWTELGASFLEGLEDES